MRQIQTGLKCTVACQTFFSNWDILYLLQEFSTWWYLVCNYYALYSTTYYCFLPPSLAVSGFSRRGSRCHTHKNPLLNRPAIYRGDFLFRDFCAVRTAATEAPVQDVFRDLLLVPFFFFFFFFWSSIPVGSISLLSWTGKKKNLNNEMLFIFPPSVPFQGWDRTVPSAGFREALINTFPLSLSPSPPVLPLSLPPSSPPWEARTNLYRCEGGGGGGEGEG